MEKMDLDFFVTVSVMVLLLFSSSSNDQMQCVDLTVQGDERYCD